MRLASNQRHRCAERVSLYALEGMGGGYHAASFPQAAAVEGK